MGLSCSIWKHTRAPVRANKFDEFVPIEQMKCRCCVVIQFSANSCLRPVCLCLNLTDWKPQPSVAQVSVEGFPGHSRLNRDIKVLHIQRLNLIHFGQIKANSSLQHAKAIWGGLPLYWEWDLGSVAHTCWMERPVVKRCLVSLYAVSSYAQVCVSIQYSIRNLVGCEYRKTK